MCNLYSMTKNVDAIRRLFQVGPQHDRTGNLPPLPGIFPDYPAPIVRNAGSERELAMARWGMPSSQKAQMDATKKRAQKLEAKGKPVDFKELLRMEPDGGTTNIRNVEQRALEAVAGTGPSLPGAVHVVFGIRHDRRQEGAGLVRAGREPAAAVLSPVSGPIGPASERSRKARSPPTSSRS